MLLLLFKVGEGQDSGSLDLRRYECQSSVFRRCKSTNRPDRFVGFVTEMEKISGDTIHNILDHFGKRQDELLDHPLQGDETVIFGDSLLVNFQSDKQETSNLNKEDFDNTLQDPYGESSLLNTSQQTFLQDTWHDLFDVEDYLIEIKKKALHGRLGHSPYRGVCWKLLWECLPEDREKWVVMTNKLRADYEVIRDKHLTDPYQSSAMDLAVNNPLSQEENSPWHQYFQDGELRSTICQDLERLEIILRCLFVYAKEHPEITYKQGMHEVVAPIVYVLWENAQNVRESKEDLQEVICIVNDHRHVEHDTFWLFSEIMDSVEPMFVNAKPVLEDDGNGKQKVANVDDLFVAASPNQPTSAISKKLVRIQNYMLKRYDHELYSRLQELDIAPQLYGIRWIRLLFGREYPLPGLLYLWDAMFADGRTLDLADFVFIAMLMHIRNFLLKNDYTACLMQLMKYPASVDAKMILRKALALKSSKPSSIPSKKQLNMQMNRTKARNVDTSRPLSDSLTEEQKFAHVLGSSKRPIAKLQGQSSKAPSKSSQWYADASDDTDNQKTATTTIGGKKETFVEEVKRSQRFETDSTEYRVQTDDSEIKRGERLARAQVLKSSMVSQISNVFGRHTTGLSNDVLSKFSSRNKNKAKESNVSQLEEDHERLQRQISQLQSDFDRIQSLCLFCAGKMDSYLGFIDASVDESVDNQITQSCVAGLQKVRDILARTTEIEPSAEAYERQFASIDKRLSAAFSDPVIAPNEISTKASQPSLRHKEDHFGDDENTPETNDMLSDSETRLVNEKSIGLDYFGYKGDNVNTNEDIISSNNSESNINEGQSSSSTSSSTPEPWSYLKPEDSPGDFERELLSIKDRYVASAPSQPHEDLGTALEYVTVHKDSVMSQSGTNDDLNDSIDPLSALEQHFS
eukprot:gene14484-5547_t